jgi:hypothetical protein
VPNSANTEEATSYTQIVDFVSNGFKLKRRLLVQGMAYHTYTWHLPKVPFKYANAR